MARVHLFEWEDQTWFPTTLRNAATAYLYAIIRMTGQVRYFVPYLMRALEKSKSRSIVDLCSGGGGPARLLAEQSDFVVGKFDFTLTDLFPNKEIIRHLEDFQHDNLRYLNASIDATQLPADLKGLRTIFNAFHHFKPEFAQKLLQSAVNDKAPIAIFELVNREPATMLAVLFSPIASLFVIPTIRPVKLSWLFFTYVIPAIPALILWDGLVSCLRIYSPTELQKLIRKTENHASFDWETGLIPLGKTKSHGVYLVGIPKQSSELT